MFNFEFISILKILCYKIVAWRIDIIKYFIINTQCCFLLSIPYAFKIRIKAFKLIYIV